MHHSQAKRLLKGQSGNDQGGTGQQRELRESEPRQSRYPGIEAVIHGNGAVAHVMGQVCGGVIGYPITPSTEISELFEAFRAAVAAMFGVSTRSFSNPKASTRPKVVPWVRH